MTLGVMEVSDKYRSLIKVNHLRSLIRSDHDDQGLFLVIVYIRVPVDNVLVAPSFRLSIDCPWILLMAFWLTAFLQLHGLWGLQKVHEGFYGPVRAFGVCDGFEGLLESKVSRCLCVCLVSLSQKDACVSIRLCISSSQKRVAEVSNDPR